MTSDNKKKNPIKLFHHMAIDVSNMDESIAFYRQLFGYKLTERHAAGEVEAIPVELALLRIQNNHHDHLAWQCQDRDAWLEMQERVKEMGIEIIRGPVVHSAYDPRGEGSWGENESFYVLDPDGHRLEIFCDMATIDDDGTFVSYTGERIEEAVVDEV